MDRKDISELEHVLFNEGAEPKALPLSLLKHITNGFSDDEKIGHGGFSVVYKGMLDNGIVAVKKLEHMLDINDTQFIKEVHCLMKAKHKNVVRLLGYCSDTQGEMVDYKGELVLADVRQRLLCFEYLPKGTLKDQITDASSGIEWKKRYQIINGICEGLYHLHQRNILHLDLKPTNILLDDNMVPKIADFGISRFFGETQSGVTTSSMIGTVGYLAPEFYGGRKVTVKLDIYSLGIIIIDILTGEKGYPDIDNVLERWRTRLEKTREDTQLVQVKLCTEIAVQCIDPDPAKRPDTHDIIHTLRLKNCAGVFATETGTNISSSEPEADVPLAGLTVGLNNTMANEVKKSAEELYNLTNQNRRFGYMPENNSIVQHVTDIRETSSDVEEALIIGRTVEKQKIVATLFGSITPEFTVLPIYGIGGIGKTTLAQLVFSDSQFTSYSRAWVYVSQNLDLSKIGNSIISQLSDDSHVAEKQIMHNLLRKLLAGKKILIVLDDMWEKNPDTLKKLKAMLRLGAGSRVIVVVTTRDEAIAKEIFHSVDPYKLDNLTDKVCWKIIKQKSAFKDRVDRKQLKHIGRDIATKCGGVALAAQSLGYTLNAKTSDEWESVRDNYIWSVSTSKEPSSGNDEVLASLLLSYTHMPECLKLCFSYCAVFPKGHNIAKYDLVHQWIALGFIEPSRIFDSMQLCEKYVTQLLGMSFLQYSKIPSVLLLLADGRHNKDVTLFTMHDLVHDLARAILADQVNNRGNDVGNRCRYALLTDCSKSLQLSDSSTENSYFSFILDLFQKKSSPNDLKALHFMGCGKLELRGHAFSPAENLVVLDLSECFIRRLPECIGQLKQLRYLCAPRIQDQMIPDCITELSELNYLNLRGSFVKKLPESIGDMKGLMYIDLSGCDEIQTLPYSFRKLKQLVHLDLSNCHGFISSDILFDGFTKLQYLNLTVKRTFMHYSRWPLDDISSLNKLRYLNLCRCIWTLADTCRLLNSISNLSNLEHLDLSENRGLSSIPESMGNLRKLHTLNLSGCNHLEKLPDSMIDMVSLKVLNVDRRVTLNESVRSRLNFASLPHFMVRASSDKSNSNIILLRPTNPDKLTIDRLENVKSAEEAQSIKLIEKQKIQVLEFQWTRTAERFVDDKEVLEKLVPPSSVKKLSITGYRSVSIPGWLVGISQYLPNLLNLVLCDFPECNKLPPLGPLPNLKEFSLCRMEGLKEWNTAYTRVNEGVKELMFPKLAMLTIKHCAKLRIVPCLHSAMSLYIVDCDVLLSSWSESSSYCGASSSSPLTRLAVADSKLPLHQWRLLRQLPTLRSLTIKRCSDLTMQQLRLDHAEQPSWLGELTSLEYFMIDSCQGIISLPNSIQQLTKLRRLEISGCPKLTEWCKSEENKMKVAHIRYKVFNGMRQW